MTAEEPRRVHAPVSSIVRKPGFLVPVLALLLVAVVAVVLYTVVVPQRDTELLATVNGEPIYAADIEDTLKLLPPALQGPDSRDAVLEQTIDLVLLTQEATRRGITVTEPEVETKISLLINESGRSPQELRIILGERNLTLDDYRAIVRESLLVEKLVTQAITDRVAVSEQEIVTYYQENAQQFLPPPGGVRISHILVKDESTARDVIARLNRGEGFRDLASRFSTDTRTAARGGELGVVSSRDAYPEPFLRAALALLENQYTRSPVRTEQGFHVILRNFDLLDVQEARVSIQRTLLAQKQQEAFDSLLLGLRSDAVIEYYAEDGVRASPRRRSLESFAACVGRTATLYTVSWSESAQEQQALFGASMSLLSVVDCDAEPASCNDAGIQKYPTWVIKGASYGKSSLAEIAERTGCRLP